jgi:hypothetical protein
MSVTLFRRRASDHVDGGHLASYRGMLGPHLERIELVCDSVGDIAEDLRRKSRDPDQVAEALAAAEAELDTIAMDVAEQDAPEPLRALHAEFDANLERALRGVITIERGCGLTRLPHASIYDDEPQAYWKRGHLNIIHAQMRMREIAEILFSWKVGMPTEASVAARIQQMEA